MSIGTEFSQLVREERVFCSLLAHLLMQRGTNLSVFLEMVNHELPLEDRVLASQPDEARIFIEFSYLRDQWWSLNTGDKNWANDKRRTRIVELLSTIPSLKSLAQSDVPREPSAFNSFFMGVAGANIRRDIASPSQWSVGGLFEMFGTRPEMFIDLCRLKWSFRIKPDLVVFLPGEKAIVIEAKLESPEGFYPTRTSECGIFDRLKLPRIRQIDLQEFMFKTLLGEPCQSVVVGRDAMPKSTAPFLEWKSVFAALDCSQSLEFVTNLIRENEVIRGRAKATTIPPG